MNYDKTGSQEQAEERIIDRILKQLTPENIEKQIKEIQEIELPLELQKWVQEYEKVGERDGFIWKWLYKMNKISPLVEIDKTYSESLRTIKSLFNMFIILLDDISEEDKELLLKELLKIPFEQEHIKYDQLSQQERVYLKVTKELWNKIITIITDYPKYNKYKNVFNFDVRQFLNEVRYAYLIYKQPLLMNELECWTYVPQGMQIIINFNLDLMCSREDIQVNEIGASREVVLILQKMGRIGNWLSTWEREIQKKDFTAGLFPYMVKNSFLSPSDFQETDHLKIIKIVKSSKAEKYLLEKWEEYYKTLQKSNYKTDIINLKNILKNFEQLLFMHLISKGYK